MAQGRSYGDQLREARERQGIDLVTMARRLHIRPDIVGTLENADFAKMPAHGYTKNMVRAYARQVGLDEGRICEMYTQQRERADGVPYSISRSLHSEPLPPRSRSTSRDRGEARSSRFSQPLEDDAPSSRRSSRPSRSRSLSIPLQDDAPAERRSASINRERSAASTRTSFRDRSQRGRFSDLASSFAQPSAREPRTTKVQTSFTQGGTYNASSRNAHRSSSLAGAGSKILSMVNLRVALIIAAAALIIILAVVLLNGGKQSVEEVPDIPISGLTDTSSTDPNAMPAPVLAEPTSATFTFSVAEGGKSWINIYDNGDSTPVFSSVAEGPMTKDFEVTGTLTFETANITPVTIMVDGEEVQPTVSSKTSMYVYVVDFPAILSAWKEAHGAEGDTEGEGGTAEAGSSSTASNASSASNSASASNPTR